MARAFDDASSQYLQISSAVLASTPLTIVGWFRSDDLTVQQCLLAISDTAGTSNFFALLMDGTTAGDPLLAIMRSSGTFAYATSTVGYSANTWHHAAAVFASTSSRSIYLDGGNKVTNTATLADPFGLDTTSIGRRATSSPDSYLSGLGAEVAVYNVALTDDEVAALAKGVSPLLIRPTALVGYWPLIGNDSPEPDRARGLYPLTLGNSPTKADHPRVIYPSAARVGKAVTFAGIRDVSPVRIAVTVGTPTFEIVRPVGPVIVQAVVNGARPATLPSGYVAITLGGFREADTRVDGVVVTQALNHEPDTAAFTITGVKPRVGQEVRIEHDGDELFAGVVSDVQQRYNQLRAHVEYAVQCDDFSLLLNRRLVSAKYTSQSATAIGVALAAFADGFTTTHIAAGLPNIDEITFTDEPLANCFTRLAQRIGGYWYVDADRDIHLFTEEATDTPDPIDESHLDVRDLTVRESLPQVRNRVFVEGGGSVCPVEVPPGSTVLPVEDISWFAEFGGLVKVGPQHVAYTGIDEGSGGAIAGQGVAAPTNAPTVAGASGGSLSAGTYLGWKVSYVTGGGETLAGPVSVSVTMSDAAAPGNAPSGAVYYNLDSDLDENVHYRYAYTFYVPGVGETLPSPISDTIPTGNFGFNGIRISKASLSTPPPGAVRRFYRSEGVLGGSSTLYLMTGAQNGFAAEDSTYYFDSSSDATLNTGVTPPVSNTLTTRKASLSDIPISPSASVTGRRIYRPAVGSSQFKLVTTINNNTATTYTDNTADGSLGADEPVSDTSGLVGVSGQVDAGAATIPVSSGGPFRSTGGYARIGSQVIYYGAKTDTSLTNVPTSGPGSLASSVQYGQNVLALPLLTGVPASGEGAIAYDILTGDDVNVLAVADDAGAQAELAAREGGDGVHEHFVQDRRLSLETAQARAYAELAAFARPILTLHYVTRDRRTRAGKTVHVDLGWPTLISGDFIIQRVTRTQIGIPGLDPRCEVEASSVKFSLDDLLRRALLDSA